MKENVEDLLTPNLWLALPAEMLGTLAITLLGCGSWWRAFDENYTHVALTFGLTVATVVWIFNHISGGHVNPAVTLAALFTRRVSIIRGVLYIISQIIGGIIGAGILHGLSSAQALSTLGSNELRSGVSSAQGFGVELIITFIYVLAYFACHDDKRTDLRGSAPLTLGLAAVACHLFAIPYTRAGMNPARSFGPALISGTWGDHWVFWVGPLVGGVVAGLLYEYIFAAGATFAGAKKCLLRTKKPRKPAEPEKAPLEEVKTDAIEIDDTKIDGEEAPEVVVEKEQPAEEKTANGAGADEIKKE
ncbi:Aquaporin [Plakobranchus ocellatus]|uniref:Aquaporin n=1 Tax=Plakobranchus ocellatus TaxID=259542 RepID=A0AAV4D3C2_9GAST|nr:Aquaporin [Plakobranchus ocellatus]